MKLYASNYLISLLINMLKQHLYIEGFMHKKVSFKTETRLHITYKCR